MINLLQLIKPFWVSSRIHRHLSASYFRPSISSRGQRLQTPTMKQSLSVHASFPYTAIKHCTTHGTEFNPGYFVYLLRSIGICVVGFGFGGNSLRGKMLSVCCSVAQGALVWLVGIQMVVGFSYLSLYECRHH